MRTSVVVPTFRRPEALAACLDALAGQECRPNQIIVVVRGDDAETRAAVVDRGEEVVEILTIDVPPGRPGFVAALNAGTASSSGDVVCFTDDDAEPWPDWLARIEAGFAADPTIGALGGRDWVYHGAELEEGSEEVVGTVRGWGRVTGRHHLGVGPARDVGVLKGVNLSARGDLVREIGFDTRLLGTATEHHSELGFCLAVIRRGYRVVYDPAIAVVHRPRPRAVEKREYGSRQVRDSAHNETLALLQHLSPTGQAAHLAWTTGVGTRGSPGLAQSLRLLLTSGDARLDLLRANFDGRRQAVATHRQGRQSCARPPGQPNSPRRPRVLAVPHSSGARTRAEQLLAGRGDTRILPVAVGPLGIATTLGRVISSRCEILYLVDVGKSTTPAALLGRLLGKRVIVDTGDAVHALASSLGDRSRLGLLSVRVGEELTLRAADRVVVRGRAHAAHVPRPATYVPDLAPPGAGPKSAAALRSRLGLGERFVVGLVGSLILSPRLGLSYGWDLIEALAGADEDLIALVVGDGSGLAPLREAAARLGVADRCRFVGRVPETRVAEYVSAMDVAISTQTNDLVGQVRTTGKLPLYLACGTPVLASDVGEAARLLGPLGWTLPYAGTVDRGYPERLRASLEAWRADPSGAPARRETALRICGECFDPETMRSRLGAVIDGEDEDKDEDGG